MHALAATAAFRCSNCASAGFTPVQPYGGNAPGFTGKTLVRCTGCGLVAMYPLPTDGELERFYDSYWEDRSDGKRFDKLIERANARARFLAPYLADRESLRVVDVGAGFGHICTSLAAALPGRDIEYDAVEVDPDAVRHLTDVLGARAVHDRIERCPGPYDLMVMSHFLEHLRGSGRILGCAAPPDRDRWAALRRGSQRRLSLQGSRSAPPELFRGRDSHFSARVGGLQRRAHRYVRCAGFGDRPGEVGKEQEAGTAAHAVAAAEELGERESPRAQPGEVARQARPSSRCLRRRPPLDSCDRGEPGILNRLARSRRRALNAAPECAPQALFKKRRDSMSLSHRNESAFLRLGRFTMYCEEYSGSMTGSSASFQSLTSYPAASR